MPHDERRAVQRTLDVRYPDGVRAARLRSEIARVVQDAAQLPVGDGWRGEIQHLFWVSADGRPHRGEVALPPDHLAPERGWDSDHAQGGAERRHKVAAQGQLPSDLGQLRGQEFRRVEQTVPHAVRPFGGKQRRDDRLPAAQPRAGVADGEAGALVIFQPPEALQKRAARRYLRLGVAVTDHPSAAPPSCAMRTCILTGVFTSNHCSVRSAICSGVSW